MAERVMMGEAPYVAVGEPQSTNGPEAIVVLSRDERVEARPTIKPVADSPSVLTIGLTSEEHDLIRQLRHLVSQLPTGWGEIACRIEVRDKALTHLHASLDCSIVLGKERRQSADAARGAKR